MDAIPIASRAAATNRQNSVMIFDRADVDVVFVAFHTMQNFIDVQDRRYSKRRVTQQTCSIDNWFESGKHLSGFCKRIKRDAVTDGEKLVPHRNDIWILVRRLDCSLRFPF